MKAFKAILLRNQQIIADPCNVADSPFARFLGLMGRSVLPPQEGLWFPRCSSVHMWFMKIPLDLIFLKKEKENHSGKKVYRILSIRENAAPWRALPYLETKATDTLEVAAGTCARLGLGKGDLVCLS